MLSRRVTSVYCRPPRRCSPSAAANGLQELEHERRGGRGGWAERRGNPITETPVWTFPPPPTLSGRIGEGSLPPPGRRGAEPGSGEETLSARGAAARAGALTWRRLSSGGAGLAARAGRDRASGGREDEACLSEGVLLPFRAEGPGGWEAGSSAQASPVSRRRAVCLRGGAGAPTPSEPRADDAASRDGVGWGRSLDQQHPSRRGEEGAFAALRDGGRPSGSLSPHPVSP